MTDTDSSRSWIGAMLTVLQRLAAPADEQLSYLARLGVEGSVDELALEFDDVLRPLMPLLSRSGAHEAIGALGEVDGALTSDNLEWSVTALGTSPAWARIRLLADRAKRFLSAVGA